MIGLVASEGEGEEGEKHPMSPSMMLPLQDEFIQVDLVPQDHPELKFGVLALSVV